MQIVVQLSILSLVWDKLEAIFVSIIVTVPEQICKLLKLLSLIKVVYSLRYCCKAGNGNIMTNNMLACLLRFLKFINICN